VIDEVVDLGVLGGNQPEAQAGDTPSLGPVPAFPHLHRPDLTRPMGETFINHIRHTRYPCQTEGCDKILERR
jgi:hypothetical protein